MAPPHVRLRPVGAVASLGPTGPASLTTPTGGSLTISTAVAEPGFSPLDLLYSALASCLVLSARIAANRLGLTHAITDIRAHVGGVKAEGEPNRIARFEIRVEIDGALEEAQRHAIVHLAEELCTVSNTLRSSPDFAGPL